jgi:hypothetical protein
MPGEKKIPVSYKLSPEIVAWLRLQTVSMAQIIEMSLMTCHGDEIRGNCGRCGGRMSPGVAMWQTVVGEPDMGGEVVTMSPGGPGRLIECRKCEQCGHSVGAGK